MSRLGFGATEWTWVERFAEQFRLCAIGAGTDTVLLAEDRSRPELVETARLALQRIGASTSMVIVPTAPNRGPVPLRSTGTSLSLAGHPSALAAATEAEVVIDCTVEGLLHTPELQEILEAETLVFMISNEHPETFERLPARPELKERVELGKKLLEDAAEMRVTSEAGTDLTVDLTDAYKVGSYGWTDQAGDIAHWPGGLVLAFPGQGTVNGRVVLAPGDLNLTFKEYVRDQITLEVEDDFVRRIDGDGLDADLLRSYLSAFEDEMAYASSHIGWGMNPHARWDSLALWDKADINGTEARAFAGNFMYSTGANEHARRFTRAHFDWPMRNCTVRLDGNPVVEVGQLVGDLIPGEAEVRNL